MLDVARLARLERVTAAMEVHVEACALALDPTALVVVEWLAEHSATDPDPEVLDAETDGALTRLASLTMRARTALRDQLVVTTVVGRTDEGPEGAEVVRDDQGCSVMLVVGSSGMAPGQLVTVDVEPLPNQAGGSVALWVRPAFESVPNPSKTDPGRQRPFSDDVRSDTSSTPPVPVTRRRRSSRFREVDDDELRDGFTTTDVVRMLGIRSDEVCRMHLRRDLYVSGQSSLGKRVRVFPRWQFTESGPIPGLRHVLAALPDDVRPPVFSAFMVTATEALGGHSPVDWLVGGGDVERVLALVGELVE